MITQFQVQDGWLYVLLNDGTMNRKFMTHASLAEWENIELPVVLELVTSIQSKSGEAKSILSS